MGITGVWQWVIVLVLVLLLFGAGKIPRLMGDVAKGVKAFKKGLSDDDDAPADDTKALNEEKAADAADAKADKAATS